MIRVLKFTWAVYFVFWFAVIFLLLYPVFLYCLSSPKRYPQAHSLRRYWGRTLMFLCFLFPSTEYETELDPDAVYIFTPNHFSYLDILSVNVQMPYYFNFMAKSELADIPLFSIFFKTIDVPVVRQSLTGAKEAYNAALNRLNNGTSMLSFPEGGIGKRVPELSSFKLGAFKMAIETGKPIVPITLADNWKRMRGGGLMEGGTPGKMRMYVHRPISTKNLKAGDETMLAQEVYRIIETKFKELNA